MDASGSVSSERFTKRGRSPRSCNPRVNKSNTSKKNGFLKLFETNPIILVRPVVSDDANAFGLYPSSKAAFFTFSRVFKETDAPSV